MLGGVGLGKALLPLPAPQGPGKWGGHRPWRPASPGLTVPVGSEGGPSAVCGKAARLLPRPPPQLQQGPGAWTPGYQPRAFSLEQEGAELWFYSCQETAPSSKPGPCQSLGSPAGRQQGGGDSVEEVHTQPWAEGTPGLGGPQDRAEPRTRGEVRVSPQCA